MLGGGGLFGGFYADGGRPPVGLPSIVGEKRPEVFVPDTAGRIIPSIPEYLSEFAGDDYDPGDGEIIQFHMNVYPGLPGQVRAEVLNVEREMQRRFFKAYDEYKRKRIN